MAAYLVERGSPIGLEHNPRASGETPHRLHSERNCVSCATLREENAYLRSELEDFWRRTRLANLRSELGLSPQEARLLWVLAKANRRVLSLSYLADAMERERDGEDIGVVSIYVSKLRQKVGAKAIETVPSLGYRITESGLETVRKALGPDQRSPSQDHPAR